MVETSFIHPTRSPSAASESSPRQSSRARRRGADSTDHRSPSELLKEIGIAGAEVVKILKGRGWEVCEPKGLEEYKCYYLPGGRAKGDNANRGEDYVVGEGELYAYVLDKGGVSYLFPGASQNLVPNTILNRRDKPTPRAMNHVEPTAKRSALESGEDTDLVEYFSDERYSSASRYPKKRCTKQKALRSDENVIIVDDNHDTESVTLRNHQISEDQIYGETQSKSGRRTEMDTYETALKLTASCAQLLKDVDLNLLRSVAEVVFRAASSESDNVQPRIHKLERYAERIQVALNCLSHRIAAIVEQSGSSSVSDATESEVHIPGFVSTGQGRLNLLQDVERYVLRVGQTLRHCHYNDPDTSSYSSDRSTKASDLRPLQRHIDKTTRELLELARRICGKTKRNLTIAPGR